MRYILMILLFGTLLSASPAGTWETNGMRVQFNSNGTFTWQINQQTISGQWRMLNQQTIQTLAAGIYTNYAFATQNNQLMLVAANGAKMLFNRKQSATGGKIAKKLLGTWYTLDKKQIVTLQFFKNGTYLLKMGNGQIRGQWQKSGTQQIQVKPQNQAISTYHYRFNKGFLVMAQSKENYMVLGREKSVFTALLKQQNAPKPEIKTTQNSGKPLTKPQVIHFLENYKTMHPDKVYQNLTRLPKDTASTLPIYQALSNALIFRACQGKLAYKRAYDRKLCAGAKESYQNTIRFTDKPWDYADSQRDQMLIGIKCSIGLIDKQSCNMYVGTRSKMNRQNHDTMMKIIKGMNDCTKHYSQDHQYLGCW